MSFVLVFFTIINFFLILYCAYKIRKIHLQGFGLVYGAEFARREFGVLFNQIQDMFRLDKVLRLDLPMPSMRGWAGSPDFLFRLAEEIRDRRPSVVVECSSGVSTLVVARMLSKQGYGHVYSLEDNAIYAEKTRQMLKMHNLSEWATVLDAPLDTARSVTPWYSLSSLPDSVNAIDILVVDGPIGANAKQARFPALPLLNDRMNEHCLILLDDADRPDELGIVRRWCEMYPEFRHAHVPLEKGLAVLER